MLIEYIKQFLPNLINERPIIKNKIMFIKMLFILEK